MIVVDHIDHLALGFARFKRGNRIVRPRHRGLGCAASGFVLYGHGQITDRQSVIGDDIIHAIPNGVSPHE